MSCKCDVCGKTTTIEDLSAKKRFFLGYIPEEKDVCTGCHEEVREVINRVCCEQDENRTVLIRHAVASFLARKEQHRVGP